MTNSRRTSRRRVVAILVGGLLAALVPALGTATPAVADTPFPGQVCSGTDWGGYSASNPWKSLDSGYVTISGKPRAAVISSSRHVNWAANPYANSSWRAWFMSLKWMQDYYNKANGRMGTDAHVPTITERRAFLDKGLTLLRDYDVQLPVSSTKYAAERRTSDGHRALVFICMAEEDLLLNGSVRGWLGSRMNAEVADVLSHQSGLAWNQTVEDMLPVVTAGCVFHNQSWLDTAQAKLAAAAKTNIDAQGASIEQSLGYANYNLSLWQRTLDRYSACNLSAPATLSDRLSLLASFLVAGTTPAGTLEQIGDTQASPATYGVLASDQSFRWATSRGASGQAPPAVANYSAGYVFGRPDQTFTGDYYTLRYGPARNFHGQRDAGSVTWWPSGRPLLTELGYPFSSNAARQVYWGARYQNAVTLTGAAAGIEHAAPSTLTVRQAGFGDSYTVSQSGVWYKANHTRQVGIVPSLDAIVIRDATYSGAGPVLASQYFHLAPGYTAKVSRSGAFTIYWGTTAKYVAYVFGGSGRKSGVTSSVKYVTTSHGVKVTSLVQGSIGRRADLGMVIVPVGTVAAFRSDTNGFRLVLTRGSVTRTVHLGSYLF